MDYGIRKAILKLNKTSYAKELDLSKDIEYIDCSNGINPMGLSKDVLKKLENIPPDIINLYSKSSSDLRRAIVDYWSHIANIDREKVALGDGSIGIIYKINKLFIDKSSKVLGYSPQFSDYIDDIKTYDAIYECIYMDKKNNYKFIADQYVEKMNETYNLFYIDNPNNPTGQLISIDDIRRISQKAKALNRPLIIDEAYGDFTSKKNSAISLMDDFDNIIVIRSFSKGHGLAGLRAAYVISSKTIIQNYLKISNPFEMNSMGRYLALTALEDKDFMKESIKTLSQNKDKFIKSLSKFIVLETDLSVPILTIMHWDKEVDLEEELFKYNILSISGKGFIGLGKNFVRIVILKDIDTLIDLFKRIEEEN